jgi:hypothetical protein
MISFGGRSDELEQLGVTSILGTVIGSTESSATAALRRMRTGFNSPRRGGPRGAAVRPVH